MAARHHRKRSGLAAELEALTTAGDYRAAAVRARAALNDPMLGEDERAVARWTLARLAPEPGAAVAALAGLAFFVAVAVAGLTLMP